MNSNFHFSTNTLIIGGGPAGSTLARKLALKNIDTILIEKNLTFDKPCGGGVKSIVFEEFNIPKELENKRIKNFVLFSSKFKVNIDLSKTPMSIVLRKEFDEENRKLAKKSGAILIEGRYKSFEYYKDYILVIIKTKTKTLKIKTKYLVAADGVKSSVRKDVLGVYTNSILTEYYNIPSSSSNKCEFYFGKEFSSKEYAWVFPHGNKLSIGASLKKNHNSKNQFFKFKDSIVPNDQTKKQGFFIPHWENKTLFFKNNIFFVGDAAGQVLPFTYEGIYYAMKSAEILANAIIENKPELYEKNWNLKYNKRFRFFRIMQNIFLSSNYMTNKMIKFFKNKQFQENALKYWEGTVQPLNLGQTVIKVIKYLIKS